MIIAFVLLNQYKKTVPYCNISFYDGELNEAYDHMIIMNT